jgi:hypothetical protein
MSRCGVCSFFYAFLLFFIFSSGAVVDVKAAQVEKPAFPGAQGHGSAAKGGRGGAIIYVTNLSDAGPGSLRVCMEAEMPRNCIFQVGGIISLKTPILLGEANSYLSVLGQTAPGGGILITIDTVNQKKIHTPVILKGMHDVLIRHIRIRPRFPNAIRNVDALTVEDSKRVYVDHVSGSWATDENINTHANSTDITIAHSLFGEGLNKHSKCALLGSDPRVPQNITFWGNACVSNRDRNPDDNHYGGSCIDIINNLFFNARSEWGEIFSQYPGGTPISYVGNYFKAGASTEDTTYAINWNDTLSADTPHIYQHENEAWSPKSKTVVLIAPDTEEFLVKEPPCPLSVTGIVGPQEAYADVRKSVGAFPRDSVDARFIKEIGEIGEPGGGDMVRAAGELPVIAAGKAYIDQDADGMADAMEAAVGARAGSSDAWDDSDGDGWSNFDQVMETLAEQRLSDQYPN